MVFITGESRLNQKVTVSFNKSWFKHDYENKKMETIHNKRSHQHDYKTSLEGIKERINTELTKPVGLKWIFSIKSNGTYK